MMVPSSNSHCPRSRANDIGSRITICYLRHVRLHRNWTLYDQDKQLNPILSQDVNLLLSDVYTSILVSLETLFGYTASILFSCILSYERPGDVLPPSACAYVSRLMCTPLRLSWRADRPLVIKVPAVLAAPLDGGWLNILASF
jgi:hypothetical protein